MTHGYVFLMTIILALAAVSGYAGAQGRSDDAAGFSILAACVAFLALVIWSLPE